MKFTVCAEEVGNLQDSWQRIATQKTATMTPAPQSMVGTPSE